MDEPAARSWRLQEEAAAGGRGACAHKKGVTFEIGALNFLAMTSAPFCNVNCAPRNCVWGCRATRAPLFLSSSDDLTVAALDVTRQADTRTADTLSSEPSRS